MSGKWLRCGAPNILFEAHTFDQQTGGRCDDSHSNLSNDSWNRSLYGAGGEHQWDPLEPGIQAGQGGRDDIACIHLDDPQFAEKLDGLFDRKGLTPAQHKAEFDKLWADYKLKTEPAATSSSSKEPCA